MKYDIPITSPDHAVFCVDEAERRYCGKAIRDELNMLVIEDAEGLYHTDDVLRALSFYHEEDWFTDPSWILKRKETNDE